MNKNYRNYFKIFYVFIFSVIISLIVMFSYPKQNKNYDSNESYESRVYSYQKLGTFGVAVDGDGLVLVSDKYLVTFDYKMPVNFNTSLIDNSNSKYYFYINKIDIDKQKDNHSKVDLRKKVKDFNSNMELRIIDNLIYTSKKSGKKKYYLKLFVHSQADTQSDFIFFDLSSNKIFEKMDSDEHFVFNPSVNYAEDISNNIIMNFITSKEETTQENLDDIVSATKLEIDKNENIKLFSEYPDLSVFKNKISSNYLIFYPYPEVSYSEEKTIKFYNELIESGKASFFQDAEFVKHDGERSKINSYEEYKIYKNQKNE
ncbi:hypothetical protein [Streptococcus sanguinis]|uniref:Uncharacterized protein n=1 Tax=Streptococcus sanguinis TaxID=1305 RepID=A0A0B7GQ80_STRSA|nr:hypothetical protein [Streptococcus sanguinis]CEL90368.1 protein of unknown function [Streptococcus sanguinis]